MPKKPKTSSTAYDSKKKIPIRANVCPTLGRRTMAWILVLVGT